MCGPQTTCRLFNNHPPCEDRLCAMSAASNSNLNGAYMRFFASPLRTIAPFWVDPLHSLQIVLWELVGKSWVWKETKQTNGHKRNAAVNISLATEHNRVRLTRQEEGVVLVSGRVLLGLEQGVKVPERALNKVVGGHLGEAEKSRQFSQFVGLDTSTLVIFLSPQSLRIGCHTNSMISTMLARKLHIYTWIYSCCAADFTVSAEQWKRNNFYSC